MQLGVKVQVIQVVMMHQLLGQKGRREAGSWAPGAFYVVAKDATLNIQTLGAGNEEKWTL